MNRIYVILTAGLILMAAMPANAQRTLYVNSATGSDAVTKAGNSEASPWRTIGRAAWGSAERNAPNSSEAASAGDTVHIAGGVYTFNGTISNRWGVVYNPVNSGTEGNYITFVCVGNCTLYAPSANSPILGASSRNYIKWFADVSRGHSWVIQACGRLSDCGNNVVNTTADTGPVVCHDNRGCWIEGAHIDGGPGIDYRDNYNAIRLEWCSSCVIRNNFASNFTRAESAGGTNHNQSIITLYGTSNSVFEHNSGINAGSGVYFKDTSSTPLQAGNIVRFNRFERVEEVFAFSLIKREGRNFIYQNLGIDGRIGLAIVSDGLTNDWIFNNTFYQMSLAAVTLNGNGTGGRFWNNICLQCDTMVYGNGTSMPPDSVIDFEHNVYSSYRQFYAGTDGNRTFAGYKSAFPSQDQAGPVSIDANPQFVGVSARDFRLGNSSPARGRGVDIYDLDRDGSTSDTIPAGAFITNTESIGVLGDLPSAPGNLRLTIPPGS